MRQTTQQRLKEALSARKMLPIELSRLSGIGKSAISQYLSGKVTPKQDKIYKLAQALRVSESWLMGYDEPMEQALASSAGVLSYSQEVGNGGQTESYTPEEVSHIKKYRALDEDGRELVDGLLETLHTQKTDKLEDSSDEITAS